MICLLFSFTWMHITYYDTNSSVTARVSKQASNDAKKLVDEERSFARAEIDSARAAVQRVEEALQEQEQMSRASGKQVFFF